MPTIAGQITRIQNARDRLRTAGVEKFHLNVPAGTYWDDDADKYITTTAAEALSSSDQLDKIAAAFDSIITKANEVIKVPMKVVTDGTTTTAEAFTLPTGFYAGATIVPYITVSQVEDVVLNIQALTNKSLTTRTGTITPSSGFNYLSSVAYKIVSGAVSTANAGYSNNSVTAKIATSGWVNKDATTSISVDTSTLKSKVGTASETSISSGAQITPSPTADTVITIGKGIYGSNRTLTVKSVQSQTGGDAQADDILSGKIAWVNGIKVTGSMPNYGGTDSDEKYTAATTFNQDNGFLVIQPALGYYNDYSSITTTIKYNPTRVFNTTSVTTTGTDTMTSQTYYETIPAGYYHTAITRKITVQNAAGSMSIDYSAHKAKLTISKAGWVDPGDIVDVSISAGSATYQQIQTDLQATNHRFTITPAKDTDGTKTSYLTQVTVDNTLIFNLLSAI